MLERGGFVEVKSGPRNDQFSLELLENANFLRWRWDWVCNGSDFILNFCSWRSTLWGEVQEQKLRMSHKTLGSLRNGISEQDSMKFCHKDTFYHEIVWLNSIESLEPYKMKHHSTELNLSESLWLNLYEPLKTWDSSKNGPELNLFEVMNPLWPKVHF